MSSKENVSIGEEEKEQDKICVVTSHILSNLFAVAWYLEFGDIPQMDNAHECLLHTCPTVCAEFHSGSDVRFGLTICNIRCVRPYTVHIVPFTECVLVCRLISA